MLLARSQFDRLDDIVPLLLVDLQGKGFLGAALDRCLSWGHFVSS